MEKHYLDKATKGAEFLLCMQSQSPGGGVSDSPSNLSSPTTLGNQNAAVAFVEMYLTTGDIKYKTVAINLADWILSNPTYPHQWPGDPYKYYSNVNHHAAFLLALSSVYSISGKQEYLDRCFQIAEEIIAWQNYTDSRDPFNSSLKTGPNNTWADGGWYWYDYSPTTPLPDGVDTPPTNYNGFSAMRSVGYNAPTLLALVKLLEVTNQHRLLGTTTIRNGVSFNVLKNNLISSIKKGLNYLINLQEQINSGNQRRGYLSSFTQDLYQGGSNLIINTLSSPHGLPTIIDGYLALLKSKALSSLEISRLQTLIYSLVDHYESNTRSSTGWGNAEWYTDGMLPNWSKYMWFKSLNSINSNLALKNSSFEDKTITWELWSWDGNGVTISNSESRTGNNSVHIVDNSTNASKWAAILLDAQPNTSYNVEAYAHILSGRQAIYFYYYDQGLNYIGCDLVQKYHNYGFQKVSMTKTTPANTKYIGLWLYSFWYDKSEGYWDDISFGELQQEQQKVQSDNFHSTTEMNCSLENYPNPFNPTTKIVFSIKKTDFVDLRVFDILGREIITLVKEVKQPGKYTVNFDASKLPSGIYIYRIISGEFTKTNKMILSK